MMRRDHWEGVNHLRQLRQCTVARGSIIRNTPPSPPSASCIMPHPPSTQLTPRWASIAALTITLRLTLLPLIIRTLKHNVRLAAVQPQMTALFKRLADAKKTGDTQAQQVVASSLTNLMKEKDVSPFRPLLMPLIQMPFFLAFFWGLRGLAQTPLPQLREGGFGWVMDLTLSDPFYVLPITSMLFTNLVLRVSSDFAWSVPLQ